MLGHRPFASAPTASKIASGLATILVLGTPNSQDATLDGEFDNIISVSSILSTSGSELLSDVDIILNLSGALTCDDASITGVGRFDLARFSGDIVSLNAEVIGAVDLIINASGDLVSEEEELIGAASVNLNLNADIISQVATTDGFVSPVINVSGTLVSQQEIVISSVNVKLNFSGSLLSGQETLDADVLVVLRRLAAWGIVTRLDRERDD